MTTSVNGHVENVKIHIICKGGNYMDQTELEKCKNDIVYFAEKYLGAELTAWQKQVLKFYQTNTGGIYLGLRHGKRMLNHAITEHRKL